MEDLLTTKDAFNPMLPFHTVSGSTDVPVLSPSMNRSQRMHRPAAELMVGKLLAMALRKWSSLSLNQNSGKMTH